MVIKKADDCSQDIACLTSLLSEPGLSQQQKADIKQEIKNREKGAWGEQRAAYYLDFHFDKYQDTILLHDVRFELSNGKTAQVDHLLINKWLDIYVLESKNYSSLTVDETGACTVWENRHPIGVASPLEQARRQVAIVKRAFEVDEQLRILAPRHNFNPRVLLATGCNLRAPHHREWYVKADAFHTAWEKEIDNESVIKSVLSMTRLVSREKLHKIGNILANEIHNRKPRDLRVRFGLPPLAPNATSSGNKFVDSIPGLIKHVPRYDADWFEFTRVPTAEEKKRFLAAGYRAKQEKNGEWIWRLKT